MKKKIVTTLLTATLALSFVMPGYAAEQSGWSKSGGKTYYSESGNNITGWKQINDKWYLFQQDTSLYKGWYMEGGKKYYFKMESGEMLTNAYGPDGHWMNEDGTWNSEKVHERVNILELTGELPYILNWETDSKGGFINNGVSDLVVISALLGKTSYEELYPKEKEIYNVVRDFIQSQIKDTDSDYDKVVKITQFIWEKAEYADNYMEGSYGILIKGKGVCSGYDKSFKLIANAIGLECYEVASGKYNHAWNIVKVDGEWYNIDITEPYQGYSSLEAYYMLKNDAEYAYSAFKDTGYATPDCKGIRYTRSTIKNNK